MQQHYNGSVSIPRPTSPGCTPGDSTHPPMGALHRIQPLCPKFKGPRGLFRQRFGLKSGATQLFTLLVLMAWRELPWPTVFSQHLHNLTHLIYFRPIKIRPSLILITTIPQCQLTDQSQKMTPDNSSACRVDNLSPLILLFLFDITISLDVRESAPPGWRRGFLMFKLSLH